MVVKAMTDNNNHEKRDNVNKQNRQRSLPGGYHHDHRKYSVVDSKLKETLDAQGVSAQSVVRMWKLRRKNPELHSNLVRWVDSEKSRSKVRLLRVLVEWETGVQYNVLTNQTGLSKRTIRYHLKTLRETGIEIDGKGYPKSFAIANDDHFLLASDVAAMEF